MPSSAELSDLRRLGLDCCALNMKVQRTVGTLDIIYQSTRRHIRQNLNLQLAGQLTALFHAAATNQVRSAFFWAITQIIVGFIYRRFETTCRSHLPGSKIQKVDYLATYDSMKKRAAGHVARMEETRSAYNNSVIKPAVRDRFRTLASVAVAGIKCVVRNKGLKM